MDVEYIKDKIKEAESYVESSKQNGDISFDIADGILSNLKSNINNDKIWDEIVNHEKNIHATFDKKIKEAEKKLSELSPMLNYKKYGGYYMDLRQWRTMELITKWKKIIQAHDTV